MIRFAWKRIFHRKWTSVTLILSLFCLFVFTPLGLEQSKKTMLMVQETIEQHGRGSFDILVRPAGSRTEIEKTLGMVEENYIGDSQGGISIEEWEEIKANLNIEIAAPVASLGYFRGKEYSIELPIIDDPTRFTWQFYTSDGVNKYSLQDERTLIFFEVYEDLPNYTIQYIPDPDHLSGNSGSMLVRMPETYHHLVAVDMESEEKLTDIDLSDFEKNPDTLTIEGIKMNYGDPPVYKIIQRQEQNVPVHMELKVETLDVNIDDYWDDLQIEENEWLLLSDSVYQLYEEMLTKESLDLVTKDIDLSPFMKPFGHTGLSLDTNLLPSDNVDSMSIMQDTGVYYTTSPINYSNLKGNPEVSIIKNGTPPAYKQVEKKGESILENVTGTVPFILEPVGSFSVNDAVKSLAASPLGIYGEQQAKTTSGERLTPTTIPGSFIPASASGLTDLETAKAIKGDKPIDAIRVKVAGITSYNKEAQQKIDIVAMQLLEKGYEVDIVAGSSFKEMTLDVEGIGIVKEPWTTLGVAQALTDIWDSLTLLTIGLFTIFSILWLVVRLIFEKNTLNHENVLLSNIGWRSSKIKLRNLLEQLILVSVALILAIFSLYQLNATEVMYRFVLALFLVALLIIVITYIKKQKVFTRAHAYKRFASIWYYKRFILPTMMILCISTILMTTLISSLGFSFTETSETTLGSFTADLTFWLQISILIFTFILAIVGLSECLNSLLLERKSELHMYHVVGWRKHRIQRHLAKEVFGWAGIAIVLGLVIGGMGLFLLSVSFYWILIGLVTAFLLSIIPIIILVWTRPVR